MKEFIKITPENHDEAIRQMPGKLYVLYFSANCPVCRDAVRELIAMPENSLFVYAVCQVDDEAEFRAKEKLLVLPTVRVYENGALLRETSGYDRVYGAGYDMRGSVRKCLNYHAVYADNAATTKMSEKALKAYVRCARSVYGNPSAAYDAGLTARSALNEARECIKRCFNLSRGDVIFTASGSEADNQALLSAYWEGQRLNRKHIITTAIEHRAVLRTLNSFREDGFEITVLSVNEKGQADPKAVEQAIRPDTILVSVMYANNEIGTIQPIGQIGDLCRKHGVLFHCDAVQAAGHVSIDLLALSIDYLSISAHKFNGPKGVGALIVSERAPVSPLILGGEQEKARRAGTENVQGACAMAAALDERVRRLRGDTKKVRALTQALLTGLEDVPDVTLNGDAENRLPGTVNLSFRNVRGRELLFLLDARYGISVSGGAACNTDSPNPSHVLMALGLTKEMAESSIRISLNHDNSMDDVEYIVNAIKECVEFLRNR